jgi:hypothetical protein
MVAPLLSTPSLPQRWVEIGDGVQAFLVNVAHRMADAWRNVAATASFQGGFSVFDVAAGLATEHVKNLGGGLVDVGKLSPWQQLYPAEGEAGVHLGCDERLDLGPFEPRMRAPFTES